MITTRNHKAAETGQPSISVVIPTHNRTDLLERAVASVLYQGDETLQVVVIDDGSDDDIRQLLRNRMSGGEIGDFSCDADASSNAGAPSPSPLRNDRVAILFCENAGAAASRNRGAQAAGGDLLLFLDSDDELMPGAVDAFRNAFDDQTGVICSSGQIVDATGSVVQTKRPRDMGPPYENRKGLFLAGTFAVSRRVFFGLGGFASACPSSQHKELALRLVPYCREHEFTIHCIEATTVRIHQHAQGHLRDSSLAMLDGRMYILTHHEDKLRRSSHHYSYWCSKAAVFAARLGRYRDARRLFWRAFVACPRKLSNAARLVLGCCPIVRKRVWASRGLSTRKQKQSRSKVVA